MKLQRSAFNSANIKSMRNKMNAGRLFLEIETHQPHLILITETWLDESTQEIISPGYRSIARRDRGGSKLGGGVEIFAGDDFRNVGVHSL